MAIRSLDTLSQTEIMVYDGVPPPPSPTTSSPVFAPTTPSPTFVSSSSPTTSVPTGKWLWPAKTHLFLENAFIVLCPPTPPFCGYPCYMRHFGVLARLPVALCSISPPGGERAMPGVYFTADHDRIPRWSTLLSSSCVHVFCRHERLLRQHERRLPVQP